VREFSSSPRWVSMFSGEGYARLPTHTGRWGCKSQGDAWKGPYHLPPSPKVIWVSQNLILPPPALVLLPPKVHCSVLAPESRGYLSRTQGVRDLPGLPEKDIILYSMLYLITQPRQPSPAFSGCWYPGSESDKSWKGLAPRPLGQYLLIN
jgi:hypothetical protein